MAAKPLKIRRVQFSKVVDFDDQLWPINCAILILAGFVAGIVIATSDFQDARIIYNGWVRLTGVGLMVGLLFWGVMWLQGKMLRRLQFCVIFSLLFHLWLAMCLHEQYLEMVAQRKTPETAVQVVRTRTPDYNWQHVDRPDIKQDFEKPVETQAVVETAPETIEREKSEHEVPLRKMPQAEPRESQRQQPNPAQLHRAELSVSRRADKAAGGQISKQQWKHRPRPNEPIPEPSIAPAAPRASTTLNAQSTTIQRRETETPVHQRQTYREPQSERELQTPDLARREPQSEPQPDTPTTPIPTREIVNPADIPHTPTDTPKVAAVSEPVRTAAETDGEIILTAAYTTAEPTRHNGAALPGGKRVDTSNNVSDIPGIVAMRLDRAGSHQRAPTIAPTTSNDGSSVQMGRKRAANALAGLPELETPSGWLGHSAAVPQEAANWGTASLSRQPPIRFQDFLTKPSMAAAPMVIDNVPRSGQPTTTPGITAGLRRPLQGSERGPAIAAEIGAGPPRKTNTPGLPRGLAEEIELQPLDAVASSRPGEQIDVALGSGIAPPSRQEGGLPVQVAADSGLGGLSPDPSLQLGLPSRRARPESEIVHSVPRRFLIRRSGGELAVDGTISEPAESFRHRDPGRREQMAAQRGGNRGTEAAVEAGLDYFARHQFPDGHWGLHELPQGISYPQAALGDMQADTAATGLALLTYLGAGYTHLDEKHRAVVRRGVDWLLKNQKPSGDLFTGGNEFAWFYSHGIATMALCEAYGMTRDHELREPAQKAVEFILKTQNPTKGGWRYRLDSRTGRANETDTSVTGWQLMALRSAQMAGLDVPDEALTRVGEWLDTAIAPDGQGKYVYNPYADVNDPSQRGGRRASRAMTAEAMLMRIYLGRNRDDASLIDGAEYLLENLPEVGTSARPTRDCYYWYYATQAMFQMSGKYWEAWNARFHPLLCSSQSTDGGLAGSWHPTHPLPDRWGRAGGRHYVTAMHVLMLEVYYRHLPLFKELGK